MTEYGSASKGVYFVDVLVTGGLGFIGSHTCLQMLEAGLTPIIVDNCHNSSTAVLGRIEAVSGRRPSFYRGDIRDSALLDSVFSAHAIVAVIHFAGLKSVGESAEQPLAYYDNNVNGSLVLVAAMQRAGVKRLVFSSSATVYGDPATVPIPEDSPTGATTNPYGSSKHMVECCLTDLAAADPEWSITVLRYFNPVGAHPSGLMGEDPHGKPNNLMPFIAQVAVGRRERLSVFGADYPTPDGTGVRDYIHVLDLAEGHVAALERASKHPGVHIYNLGTGRGSSVLDMIAAFEAASGKRIPYDVVPRRSGDIAQCWADPSKAEDELDWRAGRSLEEMAADTWRWQQDNPMGYPEQD